MKIFERLSEAKNYSCAKFDRYTMYKGELCGSIPLSLCQTQLVVFWTLMTF